MDAFYCWAIWDIPTQTHIGFYLNQADAQEHEESEMVDLGNVECIDGRRRRMECKKVIREAHMVRIEPPSDEGSK